MDQDAEQKASDFMEAQKHYYKQLSDENSELRRFQASKAEHEDAVKMLKEMPEKTKHEIMVPFGNLAFMPGELVHTNEVLVLLGDNYFAETSAHHAVGIIERRVKVIDEMITKTEKKVRDLSMRCDLSTQARDAVLSTLSAETVLQGFAQDSSTAKSKEEEQEEEEQEEEEQEEEEECGDERDDDEEGKGPEYWNAAGFVGCFADDVQEAKRDEDFNGENYEDDDEDDPDDEGEAGYEERAVMESRVEQGGADDEWDDDAPVLEIYEPMDGGESKVIKHASQKAFEHSPGFPY